MSKNGEVEQQINRVLVYQNTRLNAIAFPDISAADDCVSESEALLRSLGYGLPKRESIGFVQNKKTVLIPSWEALSREAEDAVGAQCDLEELFSQEELCQNAAAIRQLHHDFNMLHHLDENDVAISAIAGLVGAAVDILLVGIPQKTPTGLSAGKLSNYIRAEFEKKYPEAEMQKLANSKASKVPYDAQDNRNTTEYVEGLSSFYHRLLSLGHDPLLGFVIGVFDILTGRMTTIGKSGKIVSQIMANYADRTESNLFAALAKQIIHLKSDLTTSMGLPVPLMGLFNLLQFGRIGEEEQTIAEIVQGMYYEGYDFIHFCSMSVPVMLVEVIVRVGYAIKRLKEGYSLKESIPFSLDREKHPKLATMLFIAQTGATAINAGKLLFMKNPLAINYPQWITFAKYSFSQLKWILKQKPELQEAYVSGRLLDDFKAVLSDIDETYHTLSQGYSFCFE